MNSRHDSPRIFIPPPLLMLGTLFIGLAVEGRIGRLPASPVAVLILGAVVVTAGLVVIGLALRLFDRAQTRPEPWQASSALVIDGIYRFTRNPMYFGMLLVYGGVALLLLSPTAGLLIVPLLIALDRFVVVREEAYLRRRFGAAYEDYRQRVRRWI